MGIGTKPAGARGNKVGGKRHTPTVTRWAKRKAQEKADKINQAIDDQALAGSRRNLWWRKCHMEKLKADARKAERKLLETTSLGDLIK